MTQRNFFKYLTRLHRYLGLVLGLQILIWFSSGFFMSFFDINQVRGKHIAEKVAFDLDKSSIVPLNDLPIDGATSIELKSAVGVAVYKITADDVRYFNAATAARWKGITRNMAQTAASQYYKGDAPAPTLAKLDTAPIEYRGPLPVWQVSFDDGPKTRLYLDADTAELRAVRTQLWRIFDFMWMLHIMDYDERNDINNWWLWLCSAAASLFALSGIALLLHRMVLRPRRKQAHTS